LIPEIYLPKKSGVDGLALYFDETLNTWPSIELEKNLRWVYSVCHCWILTSRKLCNLVGENKGLSVRKLPKVFRDRYGFAGQIFMRACELRGLSSTFIRRFHDTLKDLPPRKSSEEREKSLSLLNEYCIRSEEIYERLVIKLDLEADGLAPQPFRPIYSYISRFDDLEKNVIQVFSKSEKPLTGDQLAQKAGYKKGTYFRTRLSALVKQKILISRCPGYKLNPEYNFLLDLIKPSSKS
jgi:hypothetical protein